LEVERMKKSLFVSLICAALMCMFAAPSLYAVDAPGDLMIAPPEGMKFKRGKAKPPVPFSHEKHAEFDCTTCHHTWDGESDIQKCTDSGCHDSLEYKTRENKDDIALVEIAYHEMCYKGCHRDLKKEKKATGPTSCGKCHIK
jgi:hypothetical protein